MLIITLLTSIIKDQLADLRSPGFHATVYFSLSQVELEECSLEIILCSVEEVLSKEFTSLLKRGSSMFHQHVCCIVVDQCQNVDRKKEVNHPSPIT